VLGHSSLEPANEINDPSQKRNNWPPDEYSFHDSECTINRTQAFQFRFQVVLAHAALPGIRFSFSPAARALQSFGHGQPIISPTTSAGKQWPIFLFQFSNFSAQAKGTYPGQLGESESLRMHIENCNGATVAPLHLAALCPKSPRNICETRN
jgi:hypothetical protein